MLRHVPDHLKTQEMGIMAVEKIQRGLHDVPDHFKAQKMCDAAVRENPFFAVCF